MSVKETSSFGLGWRKALSEGLGEMTALQRSLEGSLEGREHAECLVRVHPPLTAFCVFYYLASLTSQNHGGFCTKFTQEEMRCRVLSSIAPWIEKEPLQFSSGFVSVCPCASFIGTVKDFRKPLLEF